MTIYKSPVRDFQFVLHEVLNVSEHLRRWGQPEFDAEIVDQVIEAASQFATGVVAPLNAVGDEAGCILNSEGDVTTPPGFLAAYRQFRENGWCGLSCGHEYGGQGFPMVIDCAVGEMMSGANMAWAAYTSMSHATYVNIEANASEVLKSIYLPKLASGEWAGTMCLTEPQAGTDLGLLRTRALPKQDGTYEITGTKIFISGGDHDLTSNIVHLVLARLPGSQEGAKGISLFLVPKHLPGPDGSLKPSNGVTCGNLEKKMGIHGNSTCTLNFDGSVGWMLGEVDKGLAAMFVQMNHARIMVGVTAVGVMEAAYQKALGYAKERVQGRAPGNGSGSAAEPIVRHADVRRMLLIQKANIEGLRSVALWTAQQVDIQRLHPDPEVRKQAGNFLGLMTPVLKAMASDLAVESTLLAMQVFGGHGYIRDNGVEQHVRDVRIIGLYEGTNGVQAMDLLGRKVIADNGQRLEGFLTMMSRHLEVRRGNRGLTEFLDPLDRLIAQVRQISRELLSDAKRDAYSVGAAAAAYLRLVGHLARAWLWVQVAEVAIAKLDSGDPIYTSKLATARFYYQRQLPETVALCAEIRAGSAVVMEPATELL